MRIHMMVAFATSAMLFPACSAVPKPMGRVATTASSVDLPTPKIALGSAGPSVEIENEAVRLARVAAGSFESIREDILRCYRERLASQPDARATLLIDVRVRSDGIADDVVISGGALLGERCLACVRRSVSRARFPTDRNGGSVRLRVPVELSAEGP